MESSAISLYFAMMRRSAPDAQPEQKEYLINLIDSPGHIDFSSEVSIASRLCDGAVVLVDAVEGVCSQTVTVLRQTWIEHMKPILVINKMDRLITELKMSPGEAYIHLTKLLEQVNAVLGSFFQGERMTEDLNWRQRVEERIAATMENKRNGTEDPDADANEGYQERDDEDIYFAPEKNNVVFSSAIDGWAFTVRQFASLYEKKLGIKRNNLEKVLWGDFYLDPKTRKVLAQKHLKGRNLKPMFVQLVLEQVWAVYEATTGGEKGKGDATLTEKICKGIGIQLQPHILRSRDPRAILTTLFAQWLPLSTAMLVSVIESLPSPPVAQANRLPALLDDSPGADHIDPAVRDAMVKFNSSKDAPAVAYVSKMVSIPESDLPQNRRRGPVDIDSVEAREAARRRRVEMARELAARADPRETFELIETFEKTSLEDGEKAVVPEHLIGFARLFSGTLSVGDEVYVLSPKFTPAYPHNSPEPKKVKITALYLLMGRGLEFLDTVPAGVVFGIGGLEGHILKSGTICTQLAGAVNLAGISMGAQPIVRVALEPENPADLEKMIKGIKLLVQSDPCAEYEQFESGEHVLLTAGELHLERCLVDLKERFARCEIQAGEPIVPYRETIIRGEEMKPPVNRDLGRGTVIASTSSKQVSLKLRVRPLPLKVTQFLVKNSGAIKRLYDLKAEEQDLAEGKSGASEEEDVEVDTAALESNVLTMEEFKAQLTTAFESAKNERDVWAGVVDKIASFAPKRTGPNLLIDDAGILSHFLKSSTSEPGDTEETTGGETLKANDFADKISYAFQLACAQGPLCLEPVQGIAVFIDSVTVQPSSSSESEIPGREAFGRLTGEVIRTFRDAIKAGFLDWSPRLLLAMYSCEIQASTEVLGKVYEVLTRRKGRILSEALNEGTPFYTIQSLIPVVQSFGFSDEIRKRSAGLASPQLKFEGFEDPDPAKENDPFWEPRTEEELEDLGEFGDKENAAKVLVDSVRTRKGLLVTGRGKGIGEGEKGRTLKR